MRVRFALLVLAASAMANAAFAQSGAPPTAQQAAGGAIGRLTGEEQTSRFENEEQRRRNMTPEEAEAQYGAERVELARQVQALIDQGECRQARELANRAGERSMALRVRQTCR
ncbi:hypothetical protein GVN24_29545 [Rhizobium sp. CRIBSB]|nr:hypothetical protein [Rhizobium sp. CRIBSB]